MIATCGADEWEELAWTRAFPSTIGQGFREVIVHHAAPGASIEQSRNAAAENVRGDWLCFLDADDELAPDYLRQMRWADVCGLTPSLLIPAVSYIRGEDAEPPEIPNTHMPFTMMNHAVIGSLVPRHVFEAVGGFSEGYGPWEDWHLWLKCIRAGAELVYAPSAVYRAHVHEGSRHRSVSTAHKLALHRRITREHRSLA